MNTGIAQNNGILPVSGIRYIKEGIWAKSIDVKMDGLWLLSNKLPLNKEVEINLPAPTGFFSDKADKNKTVYPAAEFSLLSAKGDVLLKNPNLLLLNEIKGFAAKDFKALSLKFVISESLVRYNTACTVTIRLYDLKGKNQLRLEFPVNSIRYGEPVQTSKLAPVVVKSPPNAVAMACGLKVKGMRVFLDTMIKVSPKMAYASLNISGIEGTNLGGIFQGKEVFWVYDQGINEIKITDILLKEVGGALENNNVDYTLKVPFRLKIAPPKGYIIRFRWESADKTQVIDVVVTM